MKITETVLFVAGFVLIVLGAALVFFEVLNTNRAFESIASRTVEVPEGEIALDSEVRPSRDPTAEALSDLALTLRGARKLELIGAGLAVFGAACDVSASLLAVWVH